MKTIIIVLLIAIAAAGTYYYFQNKSKPSTPNEQTALVTGIWKLDSVTSPAGDTASGILHGSMLVPASHSAGYRYELTNAGLLLLHTDSVKVDTSWYDTSKPGYLVVRDNATDSTGESFSILQLNSDTLVLRSADSAGYHFSKAK